MTISLGIGMAWIAAGSLVSSSALAQPAETAPRERLAQRFVLQRSGSYLGIGAAEVTSDRAKALNLKEERGVEVTSLIEDGPAAKAGIKEGDVVLEYNGQSVQGTEQFQRLVRETPPGRPVKVMVWRNGAAQTLTATVGERKDAVISGDGAWNITMPEIRPMPMPNIEIPRLQMGYQSSMLGIEGESLASQDQLADFFGVKDGVLVKVVKKGSAAEKAGMKAGDVIVKVDDSSVSTTTEVTRALRGLRSRKNFNVTVVRNKKEIPLTVTMDERGGIRAVVKVVDC
jgi:serine protease Do